MSSKKAFLIFSLIILITTTSVWADITPWNPDDPNNNGLRMNLNFQDNPNATTTFPTVWYGSTPTRRYHVLRGTLTDYNTAGWDAWQEDGKMGISGDFNRVNDKLPYGAANDCHISLGPNSEDQAGYANILNFGTDTVKRTWTFWFNTPDIAQGTFIRHENMWDITAFWDIYIKNGRLGFRNNIPGAWHTFETVDDLNSLGVTPDTWHHVAFVIDRTTKFTSKIYLDGFAVDVNYGAFPPGTASGNVNDYDNLSPMSIGANGIVLPWLPTPQMKSWSREGEYDGLLDDIRVYHRALTPIEASILYQTDGTVKPIALYPIPNSEDVNISVDLEWKPAAGSTTQEVFFGTDPDNWDVNKIGDGTMKKLTNAQMSGPLRINTTYYWAVDSDVGGPLAGPTWQFKTITGKAACVSPADGAQGVAIGNVNLSWTAPDATSFDVYFSNNFEDVNSTAPGVRIGQNLPNSGTPNIAAPAPLPGETYYWRVVSFYPYGLSADSAVWSFRTEPFPIVFNTSGNAENYIYNNTPESIPAYTCKVRGPGGWSTVSTGTYIAIAGVAVFPFNDFIYNDLYEIIVLPEHTPDNDAAIPAPLVINVNGDFYFDGTMDISGNDGDPNNKNASPKARCGGHRGPRKTPVPEEPTPEFTAGYYYYKTEFETRVGDQRTHYYYPPTTINRVNPANPGGYDVFGLGSPLTPPYKVGGGGGYGGRGGDSGRGYFHGISACGASYGDKEVPVPFGGSAGSWGQGAPGGAGGGGVEIDATDNVSLGPNARIYAEGGTNTYVACYPAGGGAGGSVKIIADGNVTIDGLISVNGGDGGDDCQKGSNTGGGGAGGRVAIFYGNTYTNNGIITADGGGKGVVVGSGTYPHHEGLGLSFDGDDGTIYAVKSDLVNQVVRKASAPTPRNGDYMVYAPASPTQLTLKWYSGYNVTPANDTVYCDTNNPPTAQIGNPVFVTRGQHSSTANVNINPDTTYYMRVKTSGAAFADVWSDVWSFKTVGWQCQEPNWFSGPPYYGDPGVDANLAGWPAWDQNHDCVVDDLDFWYFARDWQINRGGEEYILGIDILAIFADEWMTCRARTNYGCWDWPVTPDWYIPGICCAD